MIKPVLGWFSHCFSVSDRDRERAGVDGVFGFISNAESAKTSVSGCVDTVYHAWSSNGKLTLMFWVNKTRFVINPNRIKQN